MITTVPSHDDKLIPTDAKIKNGHDVLKPSPVIAYNKAKKGVNMSDQMSSYYITLRKTIKWYRKVFCEIALGTCIVNTWSLYNKLGKSGKKLDMLQIREMIITGLLGTNDDVVDIGANTPQYDDVSERPKKKSRKSILVDHKMNKSEGSVRKNRKRCVGCYKKIKNERGVKEARLKSKRVVTYCEDCPEKPTYCLQCFNDYHK
ncbi:hypothetical protein NQ314_000309 [Rhamnusium bicolor]|uniref:PiggyBac transposable element-derived protein domain-containing protein n=1 Tax=Rhamnusium bicolor TaxID=1586634 RepID=A0AAV8ZUB6_9CUCU|nr:hypothetical protein NQ314_000309 [Rhamnusium bicolor]